MILSNRSEYTRSDTAGDDPRIHNTKSMQTMARPLLIGENAGDEPQDLYTPPPAVVADIMALIKKHAQPNTKLLSDSDELVFFNRDWQPDAPKITNGFKDHSTDPHLDTTTTLTKPWSSLMVKEVDINSNYEKLHKLKDSIPVLSDKEREFFVRGDGSLIIDVRTLHKAKIGRPKSGTYTMKRNGKYSCNIPIVRKVFENIQTEKAKSPMINETFEVDQNVDLDKLTEIQKSLLEATTRDITDMATTIEYYNAPPVYQFNPDSEALQNLGKIDNETDTDKIESPPKSDRSATTSKQVENVFEEKKFEEFFSRITRPDDSKFLVPKVPALRKPKRIIPQAPSNLKWPSADSKQSVDGGVADIKISFENKPEGQLAASTLEIDSSDDDDEPALSKF